MTLKDGPGEGTWAVFAEKVAAERDVVVAEHAALRRKLDETINVVIYNARKDAQAREARLLQVENERDALRRELDRIANNERLEADGMHSLELEHAAVLADRRAVEAERDGALRVIAWVRHLAAEVGGDIGETIALALDRAVHHAKTKEPPK